MLTALYMILFLVLVLGLVRAFRLRRGFGRLILAELICAAGALGGMWYFDTLTARESMIGWAYFSEVFTSLCAAVCFCLLVLITAVIWLLRK